MMSKTAAVVCGLVAAAGVGFAAEQPSGTEIDLDQGWDAKAIAGWVTANQGSRLIPLAWFKALEQPGGTALFLDPAHIEGFRYLPGGQDGLPLGFVVDGQDDSLFVETKRRWRANQRSQEPWVGMTCAACHTHDIEYGGRRMRVYGGSTLADFQGFLGALNDALQQTGADDAKFDRFAARVLGDAAAASDKGLLRGELERTIRYQLALARMNQTDTAYGYSRLDAIGHIDNKVIFIANPYLGGGNRPDAPVSYPFLWNVAQQSRVEWNGSVKAVRLPTRQPFDLGAVGRNVGEVVGVFGEVVAPDNPKSSHFVSSIHVDNLLYLEQQLAKLRPPRWPTEILPVDMALAGEGRGLYRAQCAGCHVELKRADLKTRRAPDGKPLDRMSPLAPRKTTVAPIGTDPWMACNATLNVADLGRLEGRKIPTQDGDSAHVVDMLTHVVKGLMKTDTPRLVKSFLRSAIGKEVRPAAYAGSFIRIAALTRQAPPYEVRRAKCEEAARSGKYETLAYRARPLTGVWATGPFLHNGSAPTLYDLLLPPAERPKTFYQGTRRFDPVRVGFVATPGPDNTFAFRVVDEAGQPIEGNSNLGHDYGNANLTTRQRQAIVEYMKIMGEKGLSWPPGVSRRVAQAGSGGSAPR